MTAESFPGGVLPLGVVTLTYEIDLSTARGHLLDRAQSDAALSEFAS